MTLSRLKFQLVEKVFLCPSYQKIKLEHFFGNHHLETLVKLSRATNFINNSLDIADTFETILQNKKEMGSHKPLTMQIKKDMTAK